MSQRLTPNNTPVVAKAADVERGNCLDSSVQGDRQVGQGIQAAVAQAITSSTLGEDRRPALVRWWHVVQLLVIVRLKVWAENRLLGYWWWLLEPLAMTGVYLLVITVAFRSAIPAHALFVMCAILPWSWFASGTMQAASALTRNGRVLQSFDLDYTMFPTAEVFATAVRFAVSLPVFFPLMIFYDRPITIHLMWLVVLFAIELIFILGCGLWLSYLQVHIPDMPNVLQIAYRALFFLSPSIYAVDRIPEAFQEIYLLNPFAALFTSYRDVLIAGHAPTYAGHLFIMLILGVVLLITGRILLQRVRGILPLSL